MVITLFVVVLSFGRVMAFEKFLVSKLHKWIDVAHRQKAHLEGSRNIPGIIISPVQ